MKSAPIKVAETSAGRAIFMTFDHLENYRVRGLVTAEGVPGVVEMARNDEKNWVTLSDSLDRTILFTGTVSHPLVIDFERIYQKYTMAQIMEESDGDSNKKSKWTKKTKVQL